MRICFSHSNYAVITSHLYLQYILSNYTNAYGEPTIRATSDHFITASIELLTIKVGYNLQCCIVNVFFK